MKHRSPILPWRAVLGVVAVLCAGAVVSNQVEFGMVGDIRPDAAPSIAQAKALGAQWRADRSDSLARDYAQALLSVGLYDELLNEIAEGGLMTAAPMEAELIRGEATLRLGRFAEAAAIVAGGVVAGDNPFSAFLKARATYAMTGDAAAAAPALSLALRGPTDLAAQAWFFRARIALDANDFEAAGAAMRRAIEAGGAGGEADDIAIEIAIRQGELAQAAAQLSARDRMSRRWFQAGVARSPASSRLLAMIRLKAGDPRSAARLLEDVERSGVATLQTRLLLVIARWKAGDVAQAHWQATKILEAAPHNWMALEVASAIAADMQRIADAEILLDRLALERPALAVFQRAQSNSAEDNLDRIFSVAIDIDEDLSRGGAASALLGGDAGVPSSLREPSQEWRASAALAAAINRSDPKAIRATARSVTAGPQTALGLTLASYAFTILDDQEGAVEIAVRASNLAPSFFEPVRIRAEYLLQNGRSGDAINLLTEFVGRNLSNETAMLALARLLAKSGDAPGANAAFSRNRPESIFADRSTAMLFAEMALAAGKAESERMVALARGVAGPVILGFVLARTGDDLGAAAAFRRALIAGDSDSEIRSAYLAAMTRLGREDAAMSLLAELANRRLTLRESPDLWKSR